ncbi:hypothetical protein B0H17DRAFT_1077680 [Mycena rosella]|uniref:Uncharacterized protein n=1 Tax=Mycena rosella TaxID=1033263 RepID=A0AAD7D8I0_MYCRO|nr:hypothetical protein B0H17DRAFT_1077680 [Mycena rosella]
MGNGQQPHGPYISTITMSNPLTFSDKKLVDSPIVGAEGAVHYTTSTTHGFRGRKITTIMAASGIVGVIDWRKKTFAINGVQRDWDDLKERSGGIFSSEREWNWANRPYNLKYHHSHKELLATPNFGNSAGAVRFTIYEHHLLHGNDPAVIYFPHAMQDEGERMFLLMAILQTEMHRQDQVQSTRNAGVIAAAGS